ncbi:helix-turn-helix domain-containing protein [Paenibacillus dokdonensis]|uniref:Helix-turn-helix domain-containing protein n=1 Tax=Paenibacillus dokdonensis TaxID=2567944 RepID=A0ABU6GGH7_9BACL|nr:ArsR family transcriptional regulator [Paenibacillus dokdonensis]MEC0238809.1 helix-turn-helix domain-containing protein [Paenibacillus dokdonensis]
MLELSFNDPDKLASVAHALSTRSRIDILQLLVSHKLNVIEIAEALNLPVSTVASHIKVLEGAKLIHTEMLPASRGAMKVCSPNYEGIHIALNMKRRIPKGELNHYEVEMPIGHYSDCEVSPTCGMASAKSVILNEDEPAIFYHPEHIHAQIIWFRKGYVEYLLPMEIPPEARIESLELSLEMCSEVSSYNNEWPSDISLWINGVEIGMWTSPGDFGDRRGKLNPEWWSDWATQYGLLKTWHMDHEKTMLDMEKVSDVTLHDVNLAQSPKLRLRIGIQPDAVNQGGVNLFGHGFGDHEQHIVMRVNYTFDSDEQKPAEK